MNKEIVNVGIIGAGGNHASDSHLPLLAATPECQIVMLSDLDPDKLKMAKQRYAPEAKTTTDWGELVNHPNVDLVLVITGDKNHTAHAVGAMHAGKHTMIEKPAANTWANFERLRNGLFVAREKEHQGTELIVTSCHPRRFGAYGEIKQLLDNPASLAELFGLHPKTNLGDVKKLTILLAYPKPERKGMHASFGLDHASHEFDTANDFFGLSGLYWAVATKNDQAEFAIQAKRNKRDEHDGGILLDFQGNRLQDESHGFRETCIVDFADGASLAVNLYTGVITLNHQGRAVDRLPRGEDRWPRFKTNYDRQFSRLNAHLIRAVLGREKPYLTPRDVLMNTVAGLALQQVDSPVAISADSAIVRL